MDFLLELRYFFDLISGYAPLVITDIFMDFFFLMEIVLHFFKGTMSKGSIVNEFKIIAWNYVTWVYFSLHFIFLYFSLFFFIFLYFSLFLNQYLTYRSTFFIDLASIFPYYWIGDDFYAFKFLRYLQISFVLKYQDIIYSSVFLILNILILLFQRFWGNSLPISFLWNPSLVFSSFNFNIYFLKAIKIPLDSCCF